MTISDIDIPVKWLWKQTHYRGMKTSFRKVTSASLNCAQESENMSFQRRWLFPLGRVVEDRTWLCFPACPRFKTRLCGHAHCSNESLMVHSRSYLRAGWSFNSNFLPIYLKVRNILLLSILRLILSNLFACFEWSVKPLNLVLSKTIARKNVDLFEK